MGKIPDDLELGADRSQGAGIGLAGAAAAFALGLAAKRSRIKPHLQRKQRPSRQQGSGNTAAKAPRGQRSSSCKLAVFEASKWLATERRPDACSRRWGHPLHQSDPANRPARWRASVWADWNGIRWGVNHQNNRLRRNSIGVQISSEALDRLKVDPLVIDPNCYRSDTSGLMLYRSRGTVIRWDWVKVTLSPAAMSSKANAIVHKVLFNSACPIWADWQGSG